MIEIKLDDPKDMTANELRTEIASHELRLLKLRQELYRRERSGQAFSKEGE